MGHSIVEFITIERGKEEKKAKKLKNNNNSEAERREIKDRKNGVREDRRQTQQRMEQRG